MPRAVRRTANSAQDGQQGDENRQAEYDRVEVTEVDADACRRDQTSSPVAKDAAWRSGVKGSTLGHTTVQMASGIIRSDHFAFHAVYLCHQIALTLLSAVPWCALRLRVLSEEEREDRQGT
ncbi:hypothetical protein E6O75_ATG05767 [Venturia nashicola]|uniref:Uncharacterized protein n=1 Tax=Venturia nashicola TaxID=86259 RepID=A0A4Z1PGB2_9PEZI|nr:hypothetical protein E6O75_ATG05767 [Venturia nashicola]